MQEAKRVIDWEAVEIQYRAGIRSLKDIGNEFNVSDAGIIKRAKRDGWVRDLTEKIRAKAAAKVSAALVSAEVSAETKLTEMVTIEVESTLMARVAISQRDDIKRCRGLVGKLLAELETVTDNKELFDSLGDAMEAPNDKGVDKLNEIYRKVMSMPGRVGSMKALAESLRILIELERKVYKMEDAPSDNPLAELIKRISGSSLPVMRTIEGECREVGCD
ncbi:MAG: hypothetical protein A2V79_09275 [Betaproteobacteria bacterium RBG_16_56_24]|nr:MAG: hypothetical protein A2V79_09275 [Betaproteobacteria bacterium RBG_16_56_24]